MREINMTIIDVNERTEVLINQLLEVWEDSVKATHLFLSNEEINDIKEYVPQAISGVSHLIIIENERHQPIAFMGIEDKKLEMLFIKNSERGKGLGKQLLNYGIENYNVNKLAVNEQNPNAKGFYEYMGFKTYKRTELDEQGNPYPILYMRLER
jgi:putative acetyltransferase